jgi:hypothetical protein
MLNFKENIATLNICIPITLLFILFMPNYMSFTVAAFFSFIFALFKPP